MHAPARGMITMSISPLNRMYDHLLESSHQDHSNKWSIIRFWEEITEKDSIEVNFTTRIWSPKSDFSTAGYQIERVSIHNKNRHRK